MSKKTNQISNFDKDYGKPKKKIIEGLTLIGCSVFFALVLFGVLGKSGNAIKNFIIGVFGYAVYPAIIFSFGFSIFMIIGKKINFKNKTAIFLIGISVFILIMSHTLLTYDLGVLGYKLYLKEMFVKANTFGGILGGIILYPLTKINFALLQIFMWCVLSALLICLFMFGINYKKTTKIDNEINQEPFLQSKNFSSNSTISNNSSLEAGLTLAEKGYLNNNSDKNERTNNGTINTNLNIVDLESEGKHNKKSKKSKKLDTQTSGFQFLNGNNNEASLKNREIDLQSLQNNELNNAILLTLKQNKANEIKQIKVQPSKVDENLVEETIEKEDIEGIVFKANNSAYKIDSETMNSKLHEMYTNNSMQSRYNDKGILNVHSKQAAEPQLKESAIFIAQNEIYEENSYKNKPFDNSIMSKRNSEITKKDGLFIENQYRNDNDRHNKAISDASNLVNNYNSNNADSNNNTHSNYNGMLDYNDQSYNEEFSNNNAFAPVKQERNEKIDNFNNKPFKQNTDFIKEEIEINNKIEETDNELKSKLNSESKIEKSHYNAVTEDFIISSTEKNNKSDTIKHSNSNNNENNKPKFNTQNFNQYPGLVNKDFNNVDNNNNLNHSASFDDAVNNNVRHNSVYADNKLDSDNFDNDNNVKNNNTKNNQFQNTDSANSDNSLESKLTPIKNGNNNSSYNSPVNKVNNNNENMNNNGASNSEQPHTNVSEEKIDHRKYLSTTGVKYYDDTFHMYQAPFKNLLNKYEQAAEFEDYTDSVLSLENTLNSLGVKATVANVIVGPAFHRFELVMPQGVSVCKVKSKGDDISMILEAKTPVRLLIPIVGKNAFGIEVGNDVRSTVGLMDLINSQNFFKNKHQLSIAIGKDLENKVIVEDMNKMPHLLVAGSSGQGKSVFLNAMICSLMFRYSPREVRFLLFDPKNVEFSDYANIPHLLTPKPILDMEHIVRGAEWLTIEMERRYKKMSMLGGIRDIIQYNELFPENDLQRFPYIVAVIDEIADIMANKNADFNTYMIKLSQKARACGIIMVLATQRPDANVLTGTIKTNCPSRIAFKVSNYIDSKIILDTPGAEKLLGAGDMLYKSVTSPNIMRLQGAYISSKEINAVCRFVKENNNAMYDPILNEFIFFDQEEENNAKNAQSTNIVQTDLSQLNAEDEKIFYNYFSSATASGKSSCSHLQISAQIGFPRALKIYEAAKARNILVPNGNKYEIAMTNEEFENTYKK